MTEAQVDKKKCAICLLEGDAPRWVYYFNGFSVFWYLHLDCLDGKQARRTKSSSPLGQLFDHGKTAQNHDFSLTIDVFSLVQVKVLHE